MAQSTITLDTPKSYYAGKNNILSKDTEIEVICIDGKKVTKQTMTYKESLNLPKKAGCKYINYQKGFSSFVETK